MISRSMGPSGVFSFFTLRVSERSQEVTPTVPFMMSSRAVMARSSGGKSLASSMGVSKSSR
jgi:hypothetical protein